MKDRGASQTAQAYPSPPPTNLWSWSTRSFTKESRQAGLCWNNRYPWLSSQVIKTNYYFPIYCMSVWNRNSCENSVCFESQAEKAATTLNGTGSRTIEESSRVSCHIMASSDIKPDTYTHSWLTNMNSIILSSPSKRQNSPCVQNHVVVFLISFLLA